MTTSTESEIELIVFGTCVGGSDRYESRSLPSIRAVAEDDTKIIAVREATSIFSAYNSIIREVRLLENVEALVLLHDDVVIQDLNFMARIRRIVRDPTVGVIGVVGHRNLHDLRYWHGYPGFGRVWDSNGFSFHGTLRGDVDAVDGMLMVLAPVAFGSYEFDEESYRGFLGYDADYCMTCRSAGLRVVVEPFEIFHISTGSAASEAFEEANEIFVRKWAANLKRTPLKYRYGRFGSALQRSGRSVEVLSPWWRETRAVFVRVGRGVSRRLARKKPPLPMPTATAVPTEVPNSCAICDGHLSDLHDAPLLRCDDCGTMQTWPPPVVEERSSEIFDKSYGGERLMRRAQWDLEATARLGWVQTLAPGGLMIEIGSASGEFTELASSRGYDVFGIEPSGWASRVAPYPNLFAGTLDDWITAYPSHLVDVVALFHVLEHVSDPHAFIQTLVGTMAPDAMLFIEVPNANARDAHDGSLEWPFWTFDFHCFHYTPDGLTTVLEKAGLEIVELREFSDRLYFNNRRWEYEQSIDRRNGFRQPSLNLLRVAARLTRSMEKLS